MNRALFLVITIAIGATVSACSSSTTNVTNVTAQDGGSPPSLTPPPTSTSDAGDDAVADGGSDAGADGSLCGDTLPIADTCTVGGMCASTTCGAGAYQYDCQDIPDAGRARPNTAGCSQVGRASSDTVWCCPATCVRTANVDAVCSTGPHAYSCPTGPEPMLPSPNCMPGPDVTGPGQTLYCCP